MPTIEAGPLYMILVFVGMLFCFRLIDWIDGASRWEKREREEDRRREAEGWAKWASTKAS